MGERETGMRSCKTAKSAECVCTLHTLTLRGRDLEYFPMKSDSASSSTPECCELTDRMLGDLDSRPLPSEATEKEDMCMYM